jgi:hypothetical protein
MGSTHIPDQWHRLSEEVLTGMQEWRLRHPTATLREIEVELDARWARMRARILEDVALQSTATTWQGSPAGQQPTCPQCGTPLKERGRHRGVSCRHTGAMISPSPAAMASVRPVRSEFFPLDEELALLPGRLTPRLQESVVLSWLPTSSVRSINCPGSSFRCTLMA